MFLHHYTDLIHIWKIVLFILVFAITFSYLNQIFASHDKDIKNKIGGLYAEKGPFDVIILGNSHALRGINPHLIDLYLGTNSYNLATTAQDLKQTYYLLKEFYRKNETDLVLLEVFNTFIKIPEMIDSRNDKDYVKYRSFINEFKLSNVKYKMTEKMFSKKMLPMMLFPIFNSHQIWKNPEDIVDNLKYEFSIEEKGHQKFPINVMTEEAARDYIEVDDFYQFEVTDENRIYLEKIIQLVREEDSQIVFTLAPIYHELIDKSNYDKFVEKLEKVSDKYQIDFLNLNESSEINLDRFNFANEDAIKDEKINQNQHLNYIGQYKMTRKVIDYFIDQEYFEVEEGLMENDEYRLSGFLEQIELENRIAIFASYEPEPTILTDENLQSLNKFGISIEDFIKNDMRVFVSYNKEGITLENSFYLNGKFKKNFTTNEELAKMELPVLLKIGNGQKTNISVEIDGNSFSMNKEGTIIIIYNPATGEIEEKAYFNLSLSDIRNYY